jgi:hypothetical protein
VDIEIFYRRNEQNIVQEKGRKSYRRAGLWVELQNILNEPEDC